VAPIANGSEWKGEAFHEHEHMKNGVRHVRVGGREFLSVIHTDNFDTVCAIGSRLSVIPITPDALGGRLAVFSDQFEQHRLVKARVVFVPSVPTTTAGALVIYFRNDVGTSDIDIGRDELVHAATHPSFAQASVWEELSVDIQPSDANLRYFNDESGDFRSQTQGMLIIEAADSLAVSTTFGNLYFEYDFEFYAPELTYDVVDTPETYMNFNQSTSGTRQAGEPLWFLTPATAGYPSFEFGHATPVAPTDADVDYIYVIIVEKVTGVWPTWTTSGASSEFNFIAGMCFYGRISRAEAAGGAYEHVMYLFTSLADAAANGGNGAADTEPGQLTYANDFTWSAGSGSVLLRVRRWHGPDH